MRTLAQLNKKVVYVNGDGSCALYAIFYDKITTKKHSRWQDYNSITETRHLEIVDLMHLLSARSALIKMVELLPDEASLG